MKKMQYRSSPQIRRSTGKNVSCYACVLRNAASKTLYAKRNFVHSENTGCIFHWFCESEQETSHT